MLPGNPGNTRKSGTAGGIIRPSTASSLCISKEPHPPRNKPRGTGLSTYLALTFGTLLSSQGTKAAFGDPFGAPPGFPFAVFPPYLIPWPIPNRLRRIGFWRTKNRPDDREVVGSG